jgi:hypothetical protein
LDADAARRFRAQLIALRRSLTAEF